ncbi:MAG: ABC transporter permease subunit [Coriobacteriaceae bacterium]|nr:ABC transporter permease subunit [Coriobacteriaceae bacterium]
MRSLVRRCGRYVLAAAAVLIAWHLASLVLDNPALPAPMSALAVLGDHAGELAPAFGASFRRVALALVAASALALPAGLVLGRAPRADALAGPVLALLYPIPKVVLLPIFLVFLGISDASKVALLAVTVFFQVVVPVRDAAQRVDRTALEAAASLGAGRVVTMCHVVVPCVLPQMFTALRVGSGTAVALLFLAEAIAGSSGLGYFIVDAWAMLDYPRMFAGMIGMAVLGVLFYELFHVLEYALTPWRRASAGGEGIV